MKTPLEEIVEFLEHQEQRTAERFRWYLCDLTLTPLVRCVDERDTDQDQLRFWLSRGLLYKSREQAYCHSKTILRAQDQICDCNRELI